MPFISLNGERIEVRCRLTYDQLKFLAFPLVDEHFSFVWEIDVDGRELRPGDTVNTSDCYDITVNYFDG